MHKVIKAGLAGAAAVALLAGGSTYAGWSDFAVDSGNTVGAGTLTLDVVRQAGTGNGPTFSNVKLAPGQGKDEWIRVASNSADSTPNGALSVTITGLQGRENGCDGNAEVLVDADCADTASGGEFPRDARVKIAAYRQIGTPAMCQNNVRGGNFWDASIPGEYTASLNTRLGQLDEVTLDFIGPDGKALVLGPGQSVCVGSAAWLPRNSDNATQGDSASFQVRLDLVQTDLPVQ